MIEEYAPFTSSYPAHSSGKIAGNRIGGCELLAAQQSDGRTEILFR